MPHVVRAPLPCSYCGCAKGAHDREPRRGLRRCNVAGCDCSNYDRYDYDGDMVAAALALPAPGRRA